MDLRTMEQSNDTFFHREKNSQCLLARSSTFDMRPATGCLQVIPMAGEPKFLGG